MIIRMLTEQDAAPYWKLRLRGLKEEPESFGTAYGDEKDTPLAVVEVGFRDAAPTYVIFGAFVADQLVGRTGIYQETKQKTRHKAVIWGVYVAPEFRGQGIARQLMHTALDQARRWTGVEQIQLTVTLKNQPAYRLYRSLGFMTWGIEPDALRWQGQALDKAYMVLSL